MKPRTRSARDNAGMTIRSPGDATEALRPPRRRMRVLLVTLLLLVVALAVAWQVALRQLQQTVVAALGPHGTLSSMQVGWSGVALHGLRIAAAPGGGWPAEDELRAARVLVTPDLWATLRGRPAASRILVEEGYVSLLRARDGRLRLLPSLLEAAGGTGATGRSDGRGLPGVEIGRIELQRSEVAWFDASVRRPPLAVRLTDIHATVGPVALPALDVPTRIDLKAVVKSKQRDGRLSIEGELTAATRDAALQVRLQGVDLLALQPYLLRVSQGGVRRGTMDLDLRATVRQQRLNAPGRLVLTGLELGDAGLAGVPRQAVLAFLSRNERIELDFVLEGQFDDPAFSLNENLATRVASGLAEKLGVSLGGVVEGVGGMIRGLFGR